MFLKANSNAIIVYEVYCIEMCMNVFPLLCECSYVFHLNYPSGINKSLLNCIVGLMLSHADTAHIHARKKVIKPLVFTFIFCLGGEVCATVFSLTGH